MPGLRLVSARPDASAASSGPVLSSRAREDAFLEYLYELELGSETLRRDPSGTTWLAPRWREAVEREPALQEALATYVHEELELFESVRVRADFVFTTAVVSATEPAEVLGFGLDPRYRTWIVAGAWALAIGVAYLMWMQLIHTMH